MKTFIINQWNMNSLCQLSTIVLGSFDAPRGYNPEYSFDNNKNK
jgi:hypothetical protein